MIFKEIHKNKRKLGLLAASILLTALVVSSCVYYNTFYNAKKYFAEAQNQALRDTGRPSPRAIQDYDRVIERCTYILTEHSRSKWADDALFLMARSMYYKKNNPLQARERFLDLLRVFPNSKYIPEAQIYIARVDYEMRDKREAHRRLQEILDSPNYQNLHPEVLLLKSNYYLEDREYNRAQEHLQNIIDKYPKSQQFELAFFTLGKTYLENENYQASQEIFEILLNSRASRRTKINAQYYIAMNLYYQEEYNQSLDILQRLLRLEYEPAEIPKYNLLKARCLVGIKDYDEAESLYLSVIENNRRSAIGAEACYHLAEMYFLNVFKYEKAIEYYNRIQTELRTSLFVEKGVARSAVVSQILQFNRQDRTISTIDLINEQFKLAEYYLYVMNMPDSALSVYNNVKNQEVRVTHRLDTLRTQSMEMPTQSILLEEKDSDNQVNELETDFPEQKIEELSTDEDLYLIMEELEQGGDSEIFMENDRARDRDSRDAAKESAGESTQMMSTADELAKLEEDLLLYRTEFVPYSLFASAWIWFNVKNNQIRAEEIQNQLLDEYPDNRYTYATQSLINGEEIRFATPYEISVEQDYEEAINLINDNPAETIRLLKIIANDLESVKNENEQTLSERLEEIHCKTLFSLGYTYYFHLSDSLNARTYLEEVLTRQSNSDYSSFINSFYQNSQFVVLDSLPEKVVDEIEESREDMIDDQQQSIIKDQELIQREINDPELNKEKEPEKESSLSDDKVENRQLK